MVSDRRSINTQGLGNHWYFLASERNKTALIHS